MLSGCRPSPQVLPFGAKNESHDNEHRRQLEIMMKVSRRVTFRFPQAAGHHDNRRHPLRNRRPFSLRRRAQEYCFHFRSERGEVSMEEFITHAAILGGAVQDCRPAFAPICLIMDRSCSGTIIYSRLRWHQCCTFEQTPKPHTRCSGTTISSLSKDERKAATKRHKEEARKNQEISSRQGQTTRKGGTQSHWPKSRKR